MTPFQLVALAVLVPALVVGAVAALVVAMRDSDGDR